MRRAISLICLAFTIVLCTTVLNFLSRPYTKVRRSDTEVAAFYLSCYDILLRQNHFDSLLKRLIIENMDLESMGIAIDYVVDHKLCKFIPDIEKKCAYVSSFPKDTTWKVQITDTYSRVWKTQVAEFYSMCFRLDELKQSCGNENKNANRQ